VFTSVLVAIVGTGFSGLGMAITLQGAGIRDFVLLERGEAVGGTWRDNTYPGAACDVPSHLYSFSFELNPEWDHVFARQPEIRAYLEHCADRYALRDRIRLRTEVTSVRFCDTTARWHLHTRDGQEVVARYVVYAVGALKDPRWPAIPGRESFAGPSLHSARWDHDVDLADKRVGVVGTGASAIQVVPELAKLARHVTVFQRTPAWVRPRPDRPYSEGAKRVFRRFPAAMRAHRFMIYALLEARFPVMFGRDTPVTRLVEWQARRAIRRQIPDPARAAALTPDYRMGCKRVLVSSDWYPTLALPHVEVEATGIAEIEPRGVRLADGRTCELDALVYCTGFTVDRPVGDLRVYGRDGVALDERWGGHPRAYLGITVPGLPNSFLLLGPNTGLGHNSIILMIEAQVKYALQAIQYVEQRPDLATLEVDPAALERFVDEMNRKHAGYVWQSGCKSWYLDADGQNFTLWPGSTIEYIARTRRFDPGVYRRTRWEAPGVAARPDGRAGAGGRAEAGGQAEAGASSSTPR
jgi:cation diffusion facilitator CzcD-associated flavoprotein CzcO